MNYQQLTFNYTNGKISLNEFLAYSETYFSNKLEQERAVEMIKPNKKWFVKYGSITKVLKNFEVEAGDEVDAQARAIEMIEEYGYLHSDSIDLEEKK
jgi:hypothetical protein